MEYGKEILRRDGKPCLLRHALPEDAEEYMDYYRTAHSESDFLRTYPDETDRTAEKYALQFEKIRRDARSAEICAFTDGRLVGAAGISPVGERDKERHRAGFGISVVKSHQGLGIGRALTEATIDCARKMGYELVELCVVSENERALALYRSLGFVEYGRYPHAYLTREGRRQELIYMYLELKDTEEEKPC